MLISKGVHLQYYSVGRTSGYFVDANVQCNGNVGVKELCFSLQQPMYSCVKRTDCDVTHTNSIVIHGHHLHQVSNPYILTLHKMFQYFLVFPTWVGNINIFQGICQPFFAVRDLPSLISSNDDLASGRRRRLLGVNITSCDGEGKLNFVIFTAQTFHMYSKSS